jgi:hypothetical protein
MVSRQLLEQKDFIDIKEVINDKAVYDEIWGIASQKIFDQKDVEISDELKNKI